jgi:hypothetical protein
MLFEVCHGKQARRKNYCLSTSSIAVATTQWAETGSRKTFQEKCIQVELRGRATTFPRFIAHDDVEEP